VRLRRGVRGGTATNKCRSGGWRRGAIPSPYPAAYGTGGYARGLAIAVDLTTNG
jgi:hypothetical protein